MTASAGKAAQWPLTLALTQSECTINAFRGEFELQLTRANACELKRNGCAAGGRVTLLTLTFISARSSHCFSSHHPRQCYKTQTKGIKIHFSRLDLFMTNNELNGCSMRHRASRRASREASAPVFYERARAGVSVSSRSLIADGALPNA